MYKYKRMIWLTFYMCAKRGLIEPSFVNTLHKYYS